MKCRMLLGFVALLMTLAFAPSAEARHVWVSYVDNGRPTAFAKADVIAAIQRTMREWEAHNSITALVLHWGGEISLDVAPDDFNNVVIRWAGGYSNFRAISCPSYWGCSGTNQPDVPTNHVLLSTWSDAFGTWNNPLWVGSGSSSNLGQDMTSALMHEFGHLFRNLDNSGHTSMSVLRAPADFWSRNLWNADILGVDNTRYPGHYQSLQIFAVNGTNGTTSLLRQYQPPFRVLSPASLATGNGVGTTGPYLIAYATTSPAGASAPRNALLVKLTDGRSTDVDRVVQGTVGGVAAGFSFHRPCVVASGNGSDHYLVWASPNETAGGWRQVLTAESHNGGAFTWSAIEVIPGAWTRSGISCSIDRATERLVVAYSGAGEEGIWITHRPSLTAGAGQWSSPARVGVLVNGSQASSFGAVDIAFDFFSTAAGTLAWQDNVDLRVHTVPVTFSGGTYTFGTDLMPSVDRTLLRSWPVVTAESNPILGASLYTTPSGPGYSEGRWNLQASNPFTSFESYAIGGSVPERRYTGAASNKQFFERAFLSTSNTGL